MSRDLVVLLILDLRTSLDGMIVLHQSALGHPSLLLALIMK